MAFVHEYVEKLAGLDFFSDEVTIIFLKPHSREPKIVVPDLDLGPGSRSDRSNC